MLPLLVIKLAKSIAGKVNNKCQNQENQKNTPIQLLEMVIEEKQLVNVAPISKEQHQTEEKRNKRVFGLFFYNNKYIFPIFHALKRFSMGKHLLLEVYNVDFNLLNDSISLQKTMKRGIDRAKMTILNIFQHCFQPQGCTIVIALAESHVSCHTWPENGSIAIDVYTCGDGNPKLIAIELLKYLNSDNYLLREVYR